MPVSLVVLVVVLAQASLSVVPATNEEKAEEKREDEKAEKRKDKEMERRDEEEAGE